MRERFVEQKHMHESSESARIGEKQAYIVLAMFLNKFWNYCCFTRLTQSRRTNYVQNDPGPLLGRRRRRSPAGHIKNCGEKSAFSICNFLLNGFFTGAPCLE